LIVLLLTTKSKKIEFEDQFSELGTVISDEGTWILSFDSNFF